MENIKWLWGLMVGYFCDSEFVLKASDVAEIEKIEKEYKTI